MRQIVKGRTVFIIAHRLAAVRECDVIVGMVDGQIVESGPHDDLPSDRTASTPTLVAPERHAEGDGMNASVKLICDRVGGGSSRKVDLNRIRTHRADLEFLPADLEILETPPSPIRMAFIVAICALFAFALGWSYLSHVDIIAIAQGKIQPTGRVKVIEPLEPGRVAAINVENGQQ